MRNVFKGLTALYFMIKKEIILVVFGVLIIIGLIGVVSAASDMATDFGNMMKEFGGVLGVFFSALLGTTNDGTMFFARCLILIVVYGIIYMVLGKISLFEGSSFLLFFTAGAVAVLGVRFLDSGFISSILVPYSALGASIAIFFPYLIYFAFVHTSVRGVFGRRAAWIIFGIVLVGLYISRYSVNPDMDLITGENGYNSISLLGLVFVILAAAFDPQIHNYFGAFKTGRIVSSYHRDAYDRVMEKLHVYQQSGQHDPAREKELLKQAKYHQSQM